MSSFEKGKLHKIEMPDLSKRMENLESPINRRDKALIDALTRNSDEHVKWINYQNEIRRAEENLKNFSKKLHVSVMVPIGSKAFMAGNLIHTNEVFVSHQGIFSKCSVHQALEICEHRSKKAVDFLKKLKIEKDMYENNLNIPHLDGASADCDQREIIEEYEEEKEKTWREEHRLRLRKEKQNENMELNSAKEISHEEIMEKLDNLELMDELEDDLNELGIDDDETLRKLMSGEIKTSNKERVSNCNANMSLNIKLTETNTKLVENMDGLPSNNEKYSTNENGASNSSDTSSEASSTLDIPKEVMDLLDKAKPLNKTEKIKLYKNNIKYYEKQIDSIKIVGMTDYEEKVRLLEIREYIIDYLEMLYDEIETDTEEKNEVTLATSNQKRRISFAADDQNCFFRQNDVVSDMLKNNKESSTTNIEIKKDIIKLDEAQELTKLSVEIKKDVIKLDEAQEPTKSKINKLDSILDKVEKNFQFTQLTQSQEDFDLVSKIINHDVSTSKTLYITFKHSNSKPNDETKIADDIIGSPNDIYKQFNSKVESSEKIDNIIQHTSVSEQTYTKIIDNFEKENQKPPAIKSTLKNLDTDEFVENKLPRKSILKNKELNETNIRKDPPEDNTHKKIGFEKIMGDIVEKSVTGPDPLPQEHFVDALAPKKRISRFKKSRSKN